MMRILTALTLALFVAAPAIAQEEVKPTPLTMLVPKDTIAFAGFTNLSKTKQAIKTLNLYKLCAETELKDLAAAIQSSLKPQLDQANAQVKDAIGMDLEEVLGLFDGEVTVALLEADPSKPAPRILVQFGYPADAAAKVQGLLDLLAKQKRDDAPATKKVGGIDVTTLGGRGAPLYYAKMPGHNLLFSLDEASITQAIGMLPAKGKGSLYENPRFAAAAKAVGVGAETDLHFGLFVDLVPLWKLVKDQAPKNDEGAKVLKALEAAGLTDWQSILYVNQIADGQMLDTLHIGTAGEARGLTKLIAPGRVDAAHLARVPKKALAYQITRVDYKGAYDELLNGVKAVDRQAHGQLTEMIAGVEEKLGVKLADFLGSFGDHVVGHSTMPEAGLFPRGIWEMRLENADAFVKGVTAIAKALDMELVTAEYKGRKVHHLRAKLGTLGENPFENFDPEDNPADLARLYAMFLPSHFTIEDGQWAVFAPSHQLMLDHLDLPAEAKGVAREVPAATTGLIVSNATPIAVGLYQGILPVAGALEGILRRAGVDFDARLLPRPSTLLKYLSAPTLWHAQRTEAGMTFRVKDHVGIGPVATVAGTAGFLAGYLAMGREVEPFERPMPVEPVQPPTAKKTQQSGVGSLAPDFTLETPAGESVTLSKLRGKIVVLDFWATWCGPCKLVMPHIEKVHKKYAAKGVVVHGVNVWDNADKAVKFMKDKGYTYGTLLAGDKVADKYGVNGIPALFVIGPDGKIAHVKVGYDASAEAELSKVIESLLKK